MTLTLSLQNAGRLDNGAPGELVLNRRGAIVGRAATCDWSLPDPAKHISSRHFEIRYDGRSYVLIDCSTNGTTLAKTGERLSGPHPIADGDRFQVGHYSIVAKLTGEAAIAAAVPAPEPPPAWRGWDDGTSSPASPPSSGWDAASSPAADTGKRWQPQLGPSLASSGPHQAASNWGSQSVPAQRPGRLSGWVPDAAAPPPPVASVWEPAPTAQAPASGWSSAAPDRPAAVAPDELWGRIAEGNVVDWARGGFGQPAERPADPLGLSPASASASLPTARPQAPVLPPPAPAAPHGVAFLAAVGIDPSKLDDPEAATARAGALFRHLVAGLVVMVEARARAKAQLGAEATAFSPEGHNPIKFARTPDEALLALLGAPQSGFMPAERAVEDAFRDLQSHQVATLRAMQGALRATLERFSPSAIRARADASGLVERILPAARDAALWQAYEREFGGVAEGSDEAFLDMFAKEFRQAYNDQSRRERR